MIYAENILVCIAVPLMLSLLFIKGGARKFVVSFLTGMAACLFGAYISSFFNALSGTGIEQTAIYISPIVEEVMKFFPLCFLLYLIDPDEETLSMTAVGIGTGFATFENSCYILTSGAESLTYIMIRGFSTGVMHLVSILVLTLCLVMVKRLKAMSFPGILGALSLSMTFHGLYNLLVSEPGISSMVGYSLPLLSSLLLFISYRRFSK